MLILHQDFLEGFLSFCSNSGLEKAAAVRLFQKFAVSKMGGAIDQALTAATEALGGKIEKYAMLKRAQGYGWGTGLSPSSGYGANVGGLVGASYEDTGMENIPPPTREESTWWKQNVAGPKGMAANWTQNTRGMTPEQQVEARQSVRSLSDVQAQNPAYIAQLAAENASRDTLSGHLGQWAQDVGSQIGGRALNVAKPFYGIGAMATSMYRPISGPESKMNWQERVGQKLMGYDKMVQAWKNNYAQGVAPGEKSLGQRRVAGEAASRKYYGRPTADVMRQKQMQEQEQLRQSTQGYGAGLPMTPW